MKIKFMELFFKILGMKIIYEYWLKYISMHETIFPYQFQIPYNMDFEYFFLFVVECVVYN